MSYKSLTPESLLTSSSSRSITEDILTDPKNASVYEIASIPPKTSIEKWNDLFSTISKDILAPKKQIRTAVHRLKNGEGPLPLRLTSNDCWSGFDAQQNYLSTKPACFIILGKPTPDLGALGDEIAKLWNCVHISPDIVIAEQISLQSDTGRCMNFNMKCGRSIGANIIMQLINEKLQTDIIQHRGYVISGLPLLGTSTAIVKNYEKLYSEDSFLFIVDIINELFYNACTKVKFKRFRSSLTMTDEEYNVGEDYEMEENEEIEEEAVEDEEERRPPPVVVDYDTPFSGIIDEKSQRTICSAYTMKEQLNIIFQSALPPDVIIYVQCSAYDIVSKRGQSRFTYPNNDYIILPFINKTPDSGDGLQQPVIDRNLKMPIYNCKRVSDFPESVYAQCKTYKMIIMPLIERYIRLHNPQFVIRLDGRCNFNKMLDATIMKLSTLSLPRVVLPVKYTDFSGGKDVTDELIDFESDVTAASLLETVGSKKILSVFPLCESPWGTKCPIALREGKCINGFPNFATVFFDHVFFFSSQEAMFNFCRNPRPYLKPDSLAPTCRIAILGTKTSGKSLLAKCLSWIFKGTIIDFAKEKDDILNAKRDEILQSTLLEAIVLANESRKMAWQKRETSRLRDTDNWIFEKLEWMREYKILREKVMVIENAKLEAAKAKKTKGKKTTEVDDETILRFENLKVLLRGAFRYELDDSTIETICEEAKSHNETLLYYVPQEVFEPPLPLVEAEITDDDVAQIASDLIRIENRYDIEVNVEEVVTKFCGIIDVIDRERDQDTSTARKFGGWIVDNMTSDPIVWDALNKMDCLPDEVFCLLEESPIDYKLFLKYLKRIRNASKMVKDVFDNLEDPVIKMEQSFSEMSLKSAVLAEISRGVQGIIENDYFEHYVWSKVLSTDEFKPLEEFYADDFNMFSKNLNNFKEEWRNLKMLLEDLLVEHIEIPITDFTSPSELLSEALRKLRYRYGVLSKPLPEEDAEEEAADGNQSADVYKVLGETGVYCPVTFHKFNGLWKGKREFAVKYKEQFYYAATEEAFQEFQSDPEKFLQLERPLISFPSMKVCVAGPSGSGRTTTAKLIAEHLGLVYVDFIEFCLSCSDLTERGVSRGKFNWLSDEETSLYAQISKKPEVTQDPGTTAVDGDKTEEPEDPSIKFKEYFIQNTPLGAAVFGNIVSKLWMTEPYCSRGVVIDGFPRASVEIDALKEVAAFPDMIIETMLDQSIIVKRTLSPHLEAWKKTQDELVHNYDVNRVSQREIREFRRESRIIVFQIMYKFQRELFHSIRPKNVTFPKEITEPDPSGEHLIGDVLEPKASTVTLLSVNEEADEEALRLYIEELDYHYQEPELFTDWEDKTSAQDRVVAQMEEWIQSDVEAMGNLKEAAAADLIPWVQLETHKNLKKMTRSLHALISDLKERNESLFEQTMKFDILQAKELVDRGYAFMSKFGVSCPVRVLDNDSSIPMFVPDLISEQTFPVLHRRFIYFCSGPDNLRKFCSNPLKYILSNNINDVIYAPLKIAIVGPPKCGKTTLARRIEREYALNVLTMGQALKRMEEEAFWTIAAKQIKYMLSIGGTVPRELVIDAFRYSSLDGKFLSQGFILDGFPQNIHEATALMEAGLFPYTIISLSCDKEVCVEYLKNLPTRFSSDIPRYSENFISHMYDMYMENKPAFDEFIYSECQNVEEIQAEKSKWQCWWEAKDIILQYVKDVEQYLINDPDQAVYLKRLCIAPTEFDHRSGPLKDYCPTCWKSELLTMSGRPLLRDGLVQWLDVFYWFCEKHLDEFLGRNIIECEALPEELPEQVFKEEEFEMPEVEEERSSVMFAGSPVYQNGRCVVTFADKYPTRTVIDGDANFSVLYKDIVYLFADGSCLEKFMTEPEKYCNVKIHLEENLPPLELYKLPNLGYLEQFLSDILIKACTKTSKLRPKHPGLSPATSAAIHMAIFLKLNNPRMPPEYVPMYEDMRDVYEERCTIVKEMLEYMKATDNPLLPKVRFCCKKERSAIFYREVSSSSSSSRGPVMHNTPVSLLSRSESAVAYAEEGMYLNLYAEERTSMSEEQDAMMY